MLKVFIVFWTIATINPAPCPDANRQDEWGRFVNKSWSCAVLHTSVSRSEYSKRFFDRDSAFAFYERTLAERSAFGYMIGDHIENPRIDSLTYSVQ